jgi:predicted phosphate transport protein (TIGR00153 family)
MSWFVPREAKFFDMFRTSANVTMEGAKELVALIDDLKNVEARAKKIKDIEHQADKATHVIIEALHATFITPLDRDDMYRLVSKMDDIMDYIDAASQRFQLYDIQSVTPEVRELGAIILKSAEKVRDAVAGLENMKTSQKTIELCAEIGRLENDADHIMRVGMSKLFREDIGFKELIKLKEVLELLESVTDRCKDVANIIEGIVLDHA